MSVFQYSKFQRVTVPEAMAGAKDVQGVIAEGHAELGAEPRYILQWPNADKLGESGLFTMVAGEVGQGALIQAQPPKMMPITTAHDQAVQAYNNGRDFAHREIDEVRRARAAARKRKPASKPKRKRS